MSVSTGVGADAVFTLPAMQEELRVLRKMVIFLGDQRESDARSSAAERIGLQNAISSLRQDTAALPILGWEIRALQTTVAALQAEVRARH